MASSVYPFSTAFSVLMQTHTALFKLLGLETFSLNVCLLHFMKHIKVTVVKVLKTTLNNASST